MSAKIEGRGCARGRIVAGVNRLQGEMVEVLLDRVDGQEVAVAAETDCIPESPTECSRKNSSSNDKLSAVQEFYNGQSVFITGGTGFMGKLLIEKLLRTCPGIASIYLLVRPKKGKDVHQRTEEIFDDPVSPATRRATRRVFSRAGIRKKRETIEWKRRIKPPKGPGATLSLAVHCVCCMVLPVIRASCETREAMYC